MCCENHSSSARRRRQAPRQSCDSLGVAARSAKRGGGRHRGHPLPTARWRTRDRQPQPQPPCPPPRPPRPIHPVHGRKAMAGKSMGLAQRKKANLFVAIKCLSHNAPLYCVTDSAFDSRGASLLRLQPHGGCDPRRGVCELVSHISRHHLQRRHLWVRIMVVVEDNVEWKGKEARELNLLQHIIEYTPATIHPYRPGDGKVCGNYDATVRSLRDRSH